jgi:guanylate kinase
VRDQRPAERSQGKKEGLIFVISGPSGSGKTTLAKNLFTVHFLKNKLVKSISLTTRPRRPGERDGRDYFFVTERQFKQKLKAKKILEWTRYLGYYYATPKDFVEKQISRGKSLVLCLDLKGALTIKRLYPKSTCTIYIKPPSLKVLRDRIEKRSRAKEKDVPQRLKLAQTELLASQIYDYCLVNQDLNVAVRKLQDIIFWQTQSKCCNR